MDVGTPSDICGSEEYGDPFLRLKMKCFAKLSHKKGNLLLTRYNLSFHVVVHFLFLLILHDWVGVLRLCKS